MLALLFLLFIMFPILEIYVLVKVGGQYGVMNTLFLLLLIAIVGSGLARSQGRALLSKSQAALARGEVPAGAALHGIFVFLGGLLLVIPGFISDFVGLLCVLPGSRHLLVELARRKLAHQAKLGRIHVFTAGSSMNYQERYQDFRPGQENSQERDVSPKVIDVTPIRHIPTPNDDD